jgi:hypothetical protein
MDVDNSGGTTQGRVGTPVSSGLPGGRRDPPGGEKIGEGPSIPDRTPKDPDLNRAKDQSEKDKRETYRRTLEPGFTYVEYIDGTLKQGRAEMLMITAKLEAQDKTLDIGSDRMKGKFSWNSNKGHFMLPDGRRVTTTDSYKEIHKRLLSSAQDSARKAIEDGRDGGNEGQEGKGDDTSGNEGQEGQQGQGGQGGQQGQGGSPEQVDTSDWTQWLKDNLDMKRAGMALNFPGTRDLETRNIPSRLLDYRNIADVEIGDLRAGVSRYMPILAGVLISAGVLAYLSRTGLIGVLMGWDDAERLQRSMNPSLYRSEEDEDRSGSEDKEEKKDQKEDKQKVPEAKVEQPKVNADEERRKSKKL